MVTRRPQPPLVYGYVRSSLDRPEYVAGCREALQTWCAREGWHLGGVFTDVGSSLDIEGRIGFRGLLDAVAMPASSGVVLVDGAHLASRVEVVTELVRLIRRTGAAIRIMDGGLPPDAERLCQGQAEWRS